ncbi:hypothetical protein [Streptomyces colonosanans]|uniref:hypothetical protein n=1 Tax=Streptomyces colonosanans TaxID=1428652 RepID=UPI0015A6982C|nr:hypothetical protein [Streptomyces colonosanans]
MLAADRSFPITEVVMARLADALVIVRQFRTRRVAADRGWWLAPAILTTRRVGA